MRFTSQALAVWFVLAFGLPKAAAIMPANNSARDFAAIQNRNVFGLRPPQQPVVSNAPVVSSKLILQGITTILGNKRALLKEEPPALPGSKAPATNQDQSFILTEGQREGNLEVLQIDEVGGSVKVNHSGTVMTLTFEKDGAKPPSTPPSASPFPPGATGAVTIPVPLTPGIQPPGSAVRTNNGLTNPRRTPRWPMNGGEAQASQASQAPSPTGLAGSPTVAAPAATPTASDLPQGLTPEEQAIVLQLRNAAPVPQPETPNPNPVPPAPQGIAPAYTPRNILPQ